jgi:P-type E1-E2 ATPase
MSSVCMQDTFQLYALFFARTHTRMSSVHMQDTFQLYAFALTLQLLNLITFAWRASVAYPQTPRAWVNKLLDTLTYSAPASIPTIFLVLTYIARMRLDKAGISLLYSKALHVGAYVNMVCFDKTGTLTDSVVSLFFLLLHVGAYVNLMCFDKRAP